MPFKPGDLVYAIGGTCLGIKWFGFFGTLVAPADILDHWWVCPLGQKTVCCERRYEKTLLLAHMTFLGPVAIHKGDIITQCPLKFG